MKAALPFLVVVPLLITACGAGSSASPDGGTPGERMPTALTRASSGNLQVELLSFGPLAVGQNRVFYRVTRDGQPVTSATISQRPLMQMASMSHSCPLVDPPASAAADGLFEGLLIFTMASSDGERWTLSLDVTVGAEAKVTVELGSLAVADSALKKVFTRADGRKVVLTFGLPDGAQVGANAVLVTAHESVQMGMAFAPVEDLQFTLVPEMPSMGHGSSGNVAPVHAGGGLYRGTVNFSMSGDWVVNLGVRAGDEELGQASFAYDL